MKIINNNLVKCSALAIAMTANSHAVTVLNSGEFFTQANAPTVSDTDFAQNGFVTITDNRTGGNGLISVVNDGELGIIDGFNSGTSLNEANGDADNPVSFQITVNLGSVQSIGVVDLFASADADGDPRINQVYTLSGSTDGTSFTELADINTTGLAQVGGTGGDVFSLSSINLEGAEFQFLQFDFVAANTLGNGTQESTLIREIDITVVPEPSSAALLGLGGLGLLLRRRR